MRMRTLVLGAAVGMGLAACAQAQSISTALKLTDMSNNVLTPVNGVYTINQGTQFKVTVQAQVLNPNTAAASGHTDPAFDGAKLGIQNYTFNLLTSGVNVVSPDQNNAFTPPRWANYVKGTNGYAFVNVVDKDADTDLDVAGAGVNLSSVSAADGNDVSKYQVGALNLATLCTGTYTAGGIGSTTLAIQTAAANVYSQSTGADVDSLPAVAPVGGVTTASISINVVPIPEPASLSVLGLGALGLIRRRRA